MRTSLCTNWIDTVSLWHFLCDVLVDTGLRSFHLVSWCVSVQFSCSVMSKLFVTPRTAARQWSLSITHLSEPALIHVYQVSDAIQSSCPLSSPSPPAFNLSQHQGLFQRVSSSHQVAKNWNFSISLSNEYSGLISFRIDWFDLLAVQGTFKNLLQQHSSEASVLWCSAFSMVQLSHPYVILEKPYLWLESSLLAK